MAYKAILVGIGSWGEWWCEHFLPPNIKDGTLEVVAAVDKNPNSLDTGKTHLELTDARWYTEANTASSEKRGVS